MIAQVTILFQRLCIDLWKRGNQRTRRRLERKEARKTI